METFSFRSSTKGTTSAQPSKFSGKHFYETYKDSEFLQNKQNFDDILANSYVLKKEWEQLNPGFTMSIKDFIIEG